MSGNKFNLGGVVWIDHQRLGTQDPSIEALVDEAPKADVGKSCIQSFADGGTIDLVFGCVVERKNVQLCDAHFQTKSMGRLDSLGDHSQFWCIESLVHL